MQPHDDMTIGMMRIVSTVANTMNMTRAGEMLGISKSMVSKAVSGYEQHVGGKLFNRTTRTITFTKFGELHIRRIKELLKDFDDIHTDPMQTASHSARATSTPATVAAQ